MLRYRSFAMVSWMDRDVGRLVDLLRELETVGVVVEGEYGDGPDVVRKTTRAETVVAAGRAEQHD